MILLSTGVSVDPISLYLVWKGFEQVKGDPKALHHLVQLCENRGKKGDKVPLLLRQTTLVNAKGEVDETTQIVVLALLESSGINSKL